MFWEEGWTLALKQTRLEFCTNVKPAEFLKNSFSLIQTLLALGCRKWHFAASINLHQGHNFKDAHFPIKNQIKFCCWCHWKGSEVSAELLERAARSGCCGKGVCGGQKLFPARLACAVCMSIHNCIENTYKLISWAVMNGFFFLVGLFCARFFCSPPDNCQQSVHPGML